MMTLAEWQPVFREFLLQQTAVDAAHDLAHIQRVVQNAVRFAQVEQADLNVVIPAAWLHDCVVVPKDSPQRPYASQLAADTAVQFLRQQAYPDQYLDAIAHAIAAHSFSAGILPQTIEAQVVQDADRIDAIGAIGIARAFAVGGALQRPLYQPDDPFCRQRPPDDSAATVDHFYTKLFKLVESMQTAVARREAQKRTRFMRHYLAQLADEIGLVDVIE